MRASRSGLFQLKTNFPGKRVFSRFVKSPCTWERPIEGPLTKKVKVALETHDYSAIGMRSASWHPHRYLELESPNTSMNNSVNQEICETLQF